MTSLDYEHDWGRGEENVPRRWWSLRAGRVAAVVFSLAVSWAGCSSGNEEALSRARADLQEFKSQVEQASQARARGDAEAAAKAEGAALAALRQARDGYGEAGADRSNDLTVLVEYADVLSRLNDLDLLVPVARRIVHLDPDNVRGWVGLGHALGYLGHEHADEAVKVLRHAIELSAEPALTAAAHSALGAVYAREGLYELARREYEESLKADAAHAESRVGLATLDVREGRMKEAAEALQSLGNMPLTPPMVKGLSEALDDFLDARRTFPDVAENHFAYAQVLLRANRLTETVGPLRRAVELDPNNYVMWNMLGSVQQALGQNAEARAAFERSLAIEPDQPRTRQALEEVSTQGPAPEAPQAVPQEMPRME